MPGQILGFLASEAADRCTRSSWRSSACRFKIKLIRDVLALDVSVVVSDIDTAWTKNPIPYFHRYPEADILTSTDQARPAAGRGCTGRSSPCARPPRSGLRVRLTCILMSVPP
jgi:hypothetical protein